MPALFTGLYSQTFDALAVSGSANAWSNDVTLPGWHLFRQPASAPVALSTYNADSGTSNSGAFVSYGSSGSSDRALGGLGSGGSFFGSPASGSVAGWFALALSNASGSAIGSLDLSFNGEQWRQGGNTNAQTMELQWGFGASFDQVSTWITPGGSFNWSSPVTGSTAGAVEGNGAGRVSAVGGSLDLSASPWAADATLWLRWAETNDAGNDHGLAIDDLTLSLSQAAVLPEVSIQAIDAVASESGDGASLRISRTGSTLAALAVPISLAAGAGLAEAGDLTSPLPASVLIPAGAASVDLAIGVLDDALDEGTETLRIELAAPAGHTVADGAGSATITIADNDRISLISAVQGSGSSSPLVAQSVTLRAVVVADFQVSAELGGFFLQEETADWDTSALTSEGLYVAYPLGGTNADVVIGDRVLLTGTVAERFGQTLITAVSALTVEGQGRLGDTQRVDIPDLLAQRSSSLDLEPYEGMWVRFPETLSVNGLFGQFRFGEVELSAGGLPLQPTNVMEPGPAAFAAEQATARRELVLDDGSNSAYRPAAAATPAAPVRDQLLRRGDTITDVEGVLGFDFGKYRLQPTAPLSFTSGNPRPPAPAPAGAGQLRLASFNVLNTFTTLNAGGALTDTGLAPRGANTAEELERQLIKLTAALVGLQADVIGLMELENDADDATLAAIVARLNAAQPGGSGRLYSFVPTGLIGSDAIKVGLIYDSRTVAPTGPARVLDTASFTDPLSTGSPLNRPALAQGFRELASGEVLNVAVNHLKSKGSGGAAGLDLDQRDGQSAFNATRTAAASELVRWIGTDPTGNGDSDWVVLGDINAYAKEDPIRVLEAAGFRNALPTFTAEPPSSYAFFNPVDMSGALDHMLISPSLVRQAVAATDWSINAAEGAFRDYNLDTNSNGNAASRDFFAPDPYRTSDHDPLLLDLDLGRALPAGLAFSHGVASGDPYADSVILWTRVTPPAGFAGLVDVQWEVSTSAGFEAGSIVDRGVFTTSVARDWTVKVEADGLSADTVYHYRFRAGAAQSMVGQTKTLPVGSGPVRLAVFSCANFTAAEEFLAYGRAAAVHAVNPYDALVHVGDYIYEYGPGGFDEAEDAAGSRGFLPEREIVSLDDYRLRYAQYHTDVNLQALRAAAPLIAIWDDHETANDSWAGGAENHQSATEGDWISRRDAALKAYHEWLPIREPGLRQSGDGATALTPLTQGYRSFDFGDVLALHILETRLTARDEQLEYPDAAAVQARIGAILADPAQVGAYASQLGLTPPASPAAIPGFAAALAPLVTRELVLATVQQAWGDPGRDLLGDSQMAWLQQRMAGSSAAWQVLGQSVLMQSMAVPAELLLDAGNPALLDKYAAPLQKLATGTPFDQLTAAEKALFAEAGKIPYNLDAWDGYGVERETILQSALALGKRLISLAGDTHNAWAGVLDTMTTGTGPAGSLAGLEFATPGVTSPGLEKYLPGADAYIRANYPAVDGLDGLFMGYIGGLSYADVNRRGFLDLTVSTDRVDGAFHLLSGLDPVTDQPAWAIETVTGSADFSLTVAPEQGGPIQWQPGWKELDLVFGAAVDNGGNLTLLDPAAYGAVPERGIQLANVTVIGSEAPDTVYAGVGSRIEGRGGSDQFFNSESLGGNVLVGGGGADQFFLGQARDVVIGGGLIDPARTPGLAPATALADREADQFLIDSSAAVATAPPLRISDFEVGRDTAFIDGQQLQGTWEQIKQALAAAGIQANAAPDLAMPSGGPGLTLIPGVQVLQNLGAFGLDPDGDHLQLVVLEGPDWIRADRTTLSLTAPAGFGPADLASLTLRLGFFDGTAITPFTPSLTIAAVPPSEPGKPVVVVITPGGDATAIPVTITGGTFQADRPFQVVPTPAPVVGLGDSSVDFGIDLDPGLDRATVSFGLAALTVGAPFADTPSSRWVAVSSDPDTGVTTPLTYDPRQGGGARFYDLDADGSAEFLHLSLADGGPGDQGPAADGEILQSVTVGTVDLQPVFRRLDPLTLTVADPSRSGAAASLVLRASLSGRPASSNQIGYVVLEASELAGADALLADLAAIRSRAQTLFSTLESSDVTLAADTRFDREILLVNGQSVRFFEVIDASLADLTSAGDARLRFLTPGAPAGSDRSVGFASPSGATLALDLLDTDQGLDALIGQEQGLAPVLDFTAFSAAQAVQGTVVLSREADFDAITGFYRALDAQGTVRDAAGNLVRPGQAGYREAALRADNLVTELQGFRVGDDQSSITAVTISESSFLAPFAQVKEHTFFAYASANADGLGHFRTLGTNLFGLEDQFGGGDLDFDDHVIGFNFSQIV
ncbi:ExeM/NucH family extracellular endonuclease [Cyanobium gracile]|uniref:Putative extracellular nuclease n=1 Tax=Cyanobium gracile (strain ATCC 27147 / PCC 6307) TaxID=292564 RepID=K9P6H2_CYAGP|nr:ExeM/NucH family extracellular endonuclease [Cyanobium gracile]AFY28987.1 putative extracellular nuclease [Cyanobium gracile PCC 6307]